MNAKSKEPAPHRKHMHLIAKADIIDWVGKQFMSRMTFPPFIERLAATSDPQEVEALYKERVIEVGKEVMDELARLDPYQLRKPKGPPLKVSGVQP
jgi:hypothetical protein